MRDFTVVDGEVWSYHGSKLLLFSCVHSRTRKIYCTWNPGQPRYHGDLEQNERQNEQNEEVQRSLCNDDGVVIDYKTKRK